MHMQLRTKSNAGGGVDVDAITRAIEQRDAAVAARLDAIKKTADDGATKSLVSEARLDELEQKLARGFGGGAPAREETWGEQFVKGIDLEGFRNNVQRRKQSEGLIMKTTITSGASSGGALTQPYRDEAVLLPRRPLRVRDLIPSIKITTGAVEYPKQTARSSAPAMVAEGQLKPESAISFTMQTTAAKVIAHWVPASRQILDDASQLAGIIDSDLRFGLAMKEDEQLLMGSGSGENLLGMITQATAYAAPFTVSGQTIIDQVGLAILQTALTDFPPDGIIMHPSDWMRIRLTKDAGGNYIFGNPATSSTALLWGLPVVATTSMQIDKFLCGSFQNAATVYDRWEPRVEISTEHSDFFARNLVAILAEERLAFAVKNPNALVYGDFGFIA
ncbi:phage major capsid protein [Aureimonas flava]|uniref:Phage major capsid protein n=1 Tax=Aureimonas flava TaxID=2320271 RepID=A0A3A1WTA9_9HYPH|nr:phage major capsid protein [Aureimonas flava]RIY01484.1 phage major capsid protein [Aureimonas flava]